MINTYQNLKKINGKQRNRLAAKPSKLASNVVEGSMCQLHLPVEFSMQGRLDVSCRDDRCLRAFALDLGRRSTSEPCMCLTV